MKKLVFIIAFLAVCNNALFSQKSDTLKLHRNYGVEVFTSIYGLNGDYVDGNELTVNYSLFLQPFKKIKRVTIFGGFSTHIILQKDNGYYQGDGVAMCGFNAGLKFNIVTLKKTNAFNLYMYDIHCMYNNPDSYKQYLYDKNPIGWVATGNSYPIVNYSYKKENFDFFTIDMRYEKRSYKNIVSIQVGFLVGFIFHNNEYLGAGSGFNNEHWASIGGSLSLSLNIANLATAAKKCKLVLG